ncbi:MAG: hypothetical protein BroJett011_12750 [Chloroflexota bacterium]|nr:MAG: hypothetical protein BroJett011_12750 [Chloroflexota bacterium]
MKSYKWILAIAVIVLVGAAALAAFSVLTPYALAQGPYRYWGIEDNNPLSGQSVGPRLGMGPGSRPMLERGFEPRFGMGPNDGLMSGLGGRWGGPDNSLVVVAAETIGLTRAELVAELQSGQTIAAVAAAHNVAVETIVDAFLAPRAERLAELVASGQLTQEQADTILATMRANVTAQISAEWSPQGSGQRYGPGYTDADGDGVCDFCGSQGMGGRFGGGRMGRWNQ